MVDLDIVTGNWFTNTARLGNSLHDHRMQRNKIEMALCLYEYIKEFKRQEDAAMFLGTTQPVISNIKNLKLESISMELLLEYLSQFGVTIEIVSVNGKLYSR